MQYQNYLRSFATFPTALVIATVAVAPCSSRAQQSKPPASQQIAAGATATPKPTPLPRTPQDAITPTVKDPGRHNDFLARKAEGDVGLLFLGDSIIDLWPRRGELSWLKLAPYKPANFAISGDCTEHVLWRITNGELDGINPKVTVIMIGTNNIGHFLDEKPEWVAAGIKKIVEVVHEKLPQTKVLLLGVFPRGFTPADTFRKKVAAINKIIAGLDDGQQTRYLDLGSSFLDAHGNLPKGIMPDGLHPNWKGYNIWFDAMHPLLDEMMR